jgi:hypothetical protein
MLSEEDGLAIRNNPPIQINFRFAKVEEVSDNALAAEVVVSGSEEVRINS